jgi:C1A family cysteine protease
MKEHNKVYATVEEYTSRFNAFKENYLDIEDFYLNNEGATYRVGINKFSDMTFQEFRMKYLNLRITGSNLIGSDVEIPEVADLPASLDWRAKGAVTPVKDQGHCGSCWAFSTIGGIESAYQIKTGKLLTLSEQQLVDCDEYEGDCQQGGRVETALQYIKETGGVELSKDYTYRGDDGQCRFDKSKTVVKVTDFVNKLKITPTEYKTLLQKAPLSIALNADKFFKYESGILKLSKRDCDPRGLNHAIVAVGYGVENGIEYIIFKNSWGAKWGENGYVRIANDGTCGINENISYATVDDE